MKNLSILILIGVLCFSMFTFLHFAYAASDIHINPDGTVSPSTAPIRRQGALYTLTANVAGGSIIIEKSNIVLDGAGCMLQGTGFGSGIDVGSVSSYGNVTIRNFRIKEFEVGIRTSNFNDGTISGNNITDSGEGIRIANTYGMGNNVIYGNNINGDINIWGSAANTIYGNNMAGSINLWPSDVTWDPSVNNAIFGNVISGGISLSQSSGNTISGNSVNDIHLAYLSDNNTISGNNMTIGINLYMMLDNNTICGNIITGGGIFGSEACSNSNISENNVTGTIGLVKYSNNNTISGNIITGPPYLAPSGILLQWGTDDNVITRNVVATNSGGDGICLLEENAPLMNNKVLGNNITGNSHGIYISGCMNTNVSGNYIANNNVGTYIDSFSTNNTIFHNNFVNNDVQVSSSIDSANIWDNGYPSGGNYWSDYAGVDANRDGIGDTPYVIDTNNRDRYPFKRPWTSMPFEDGFEHGNFNAWSSTSLSSGETASIVSTRLHHGVYSARFTSNGGGGFENASCLEYVTPIAELYVRGYFYVSQSGIADNLDRIFFFKLRNQDEGVAWAGWKRTGGTTKWCLTIRNGTSFVDVFSSSSPATGRWYCVELHWKKDAKGGMGQIWVDGSLVCSTTTVNTSTYGNVDTIQFGLAEIYGCTATTVYGDCAKTATTYIGPEPTINSFTLSPSPFSPNGDGTKDTTTIAAKFNVVVKWMLQAKNSVGAVLRSWQGTGSYLSIAWDGKDSSANTVADGTYNLTLTGTDQAGNQLALKTLQIVIDKKPPTVTSVSVSPTSFSPKNGQTTKISYTLSESCYVTVKVYNSAGTLVRTLVNNALQASGPRSVTWNGKTSSGTIVPAGIYTIKISVADKAGNKSVPYPITKTATVT